MNVFGVTASSALLASSPIPSYIPSASMIRKKPSWLVAREKAGQTAVPVKTSAPVAPIDPLEMFSHGKRTLTWEQERARRKREQREQGLLSPKKDSSAAAAAGTSKRIRLSDEKEEESGTKVERWFASSDSPDVSVPLDPNEDIHQRNDSSPSPVNVLESVEKEEAEPTKENTELMIIDSKASGTDRPPLTRSSLDPRKNVPPPTPKKDPPGRDPPKRSPVKKKPAKEEVITIDDSDEEVSDTGENDDFDTIMKRVKKREAKAGANASNAQAPGSQQKTGEGVTHGTTDGQPTGSAIVTVSAPKQKLADTKVKILVHSRIPDTKPIFGEVLLSTRLGILRKTWLSRQSLSEDVGKTIFLTWRNFKLFDWTTCHSLGIKAEIGGSVYWATRDRRGTHGSNDLEMEATTLEIFEKDRREQAAQTAAALNKDDPLPMNKPEAPASNKIRLIIRAQGYNDYRLKVNPDTTFEKILHAFFLTQNVPSEKKGILMFDGEELKPETEMQATEVGDLDTLDLHLR